MFLLMFFSVRNDSATFDEVAHIPAGYSYITQQDYRLNPEHPPLIKDLSAIPLLFLKLNFPANIPAWRDQINGQWEFGHYFLYEANINTDQILLWARFPMMLLALLFGWLLFKWAGKNYGNKVGLLTLFFYSFSPTIIAHSRYVTTDIGAAFGFFIGITTFINFLTSPTKKNLLMAGLAFGIALLLKFSVALLTPIYAVLAILWIFLDKSNFLKTIGKTILIGLIGIVVIWGVYEFQILRYPQEIQIQSAQGLPFSFLITALSQHKITQGLGQYLLGLILTLQRASGGNNVYFMGTVSASGSTAYFPILYLLKESLAFHILTIIILIYIIRTKEKSFRAIVEWMHDNFAITASAIFVLIYWTQAVTSNLNIGLRHILPTLPFIYFMVARQTIRWAKNSPIENPQSVFDYIKHFYYLYVKSIEKYLIVASLLLWILLADILAFPYFVSYYNGLGGGIWNGYKIATDSNYDWGQDLIRLKDWLNTQP
ncbi:MAG: hypothetical protein Athens071424_198, partial [Parcubacteria group bacterium Athens0714_24]